MWFLIATDWINMFLALAIFFWGQCLADSFIANSYIELRPCEAWALHGHETERDGWGCFGFVHPLSIIHTLGT